MAELYDAVAENYDNFYSDDECQKENQFIKSLIEGYIPLGKTLDIGCGTGLFLDLIKVDPLKYLGIDPSKKMLDVARRKHPQHLFRKAKTTDLSIGWDGVFGNVISLFGSVAYLTPKEIERLKFLCRRSQLYFFMHYQAGYRSRITPHETVPDIDIEKEFGSFSKVRFYKYSHYVIIVNKELNLEVWNCQKNT